MRGFEGCQDYDLALRLDRADRPDRPHPQGALPLASPCPARPPTTGAAKPAAFQRGIRAVQEALDRRKIAGWVSRPDFAEKNHLGLFQVDFADDRPASGDRHPDQEPLELSEPASSRSWPRRPTATTRSSSSTTRATTRRPWPIWIASPTAAGS